VVIILAFSLTSGYGIEVDRAEQLLEITGVKGGLIVHVGCGDGKLTADLRCNDSYIVHGLDVNAVNITKAQEHIRKRGLYGAVSVELWNKDYLPYTDNTVNLVVVTRLGEGPSRSRTSSKFQLSSEEIARVLAPNGVALLREGVKSQVSGLILQPSARGWTKLVKPWPSEIDEWTHFLYDATGNAVAKDTRVDSPRRIQWTTGPKRARDHDAISTMSAMTSSKGRIFYIFDEGHTSLIHRPAKWKLIARDAFNGVLLWKRDVPTWATHLFYFRTGPTQMTRRLVSVDERVYVTLGFDAPVSMLDAATGKTLLTYKGSEKTEELIYHHDTLLTVIGDPKIMNEEAPKVYGYWELSVNKKPDVDKSIVALRASTGEVLWKKTGENLAYLVPLSLAAHKDNVFFLDNENLHCVNLKTGEDIWSASFPTKGLFLRSYAPTVVVYDDVVMCLTWNRLCSFSMKNGQKLWERKGAIGFASPGDLFAIDGLAWTIPMTAAIWRGNKLDDDGKIKTGIPIPRESFIGNSGKEIWGIDIHTGEVKKSLPIDLLPGGHHHRCYRNKATERYLICGRRGLEYIDLAGDNHVNNWWLRGICQYGVMPANGYIYIPPNPCQCFNLIKVDGFYALCATNSLDSMETSNGQNLEKGPAYSSVKNRSSGSNQVAKERTEGLIWQPPIYPSEAEEWSTYRGNITRSGSTPIYIGVPTKLKVLWQADIGVPSLSRSASARDLAEASKLSAPTAADGKVFVSSVDAHTVYALNADSGEKHWQFTANGRVDSPPTIYEGLCIFGSGDGSVYCLKASDGELAWRFKAANVDKRIIANNRLESVWPIHGSVLVQDGIVYFAAGRSSYLDGGIRLYGLDVYSGKKLHEATVSSTPVYPGKKGAQGTGALPDILISDGKRINMRQVQFDKRLEQFDNAELKTIIATTGLLESCWFHRQNWCLGYHQKIDSYLTHEKGWSGHPARIATQRRSGGKPLSKVTVQAISWSEAEVME